MRSLITHLAVRLGLLDLDKEHKFTLARAIELLALRSLERMGVICKVEDVYHMTPPGDGGPRPRVPSTVPPTDSLPHTDQADPSSYHAPPAWDSQYRSLHDSAYELGERVEELNGRLAALQVFAYIQTENQAAFFAHIGFQPPHPPPP